MRLPVSLWLLSLLLPWAHAGRQSLRSHLVNKRQVAPQAVLLNGRQAQAPSLVSLRKQAAKGDGDPEEAVTREDLMAAKEAQAAQVSAEIAQNEAAASAVMPNGLQTAELTPQQAEQMQQQVQQMQAEQAARLQQLQAMQAQAQQMQPEQAAQMVPMQAQTQQWGPVQAQQWAPAQVQQMPAAQAAVPPEETQQAQQWAPAQVQQMPAAQAAVPPEETQQEAMRQQAYQMQELQQEALAASQGISAPVPPAAQQQAPQDEQIGKAIQVPVRVVEDSEMAQAAAAMDRQQAAAQEQQLQQELSARQQVAALQQKQALLRQQMEAVQQQMQQQQTLQQQRQQQQPQPQAAAQLPQALPNQQPQVETQPYPQQQPAKPQNALVAMSSVAATAQAPPAPAPAPGAAGIAQVPRPKGWDQCLNFARFVRSKQVTGIELVRVWKSSCEPAVRSGRATERYRLMCNSLGGAVEPFSQQVDYNVEQLCDAVLAVFHDLTAADTVR
eukprot:TRINITY_DN4697_c0_g1_i2.p1 TRINITY_DN4697_c0_g1~~TRINITY_DN4697_c0_g1_i2.p1  ORF type:complete len:497 (+),score=221.85 TRINITY_DN4697_c0_g1_i2:82-1572(+)